MLSTNVRNSISISVTEPLHTVATTIPITVSIMASVTPDVKRQQYQRHAAQLQFSVLLSLLQM
jgi:hypothetical protein